MTDSREYRYPPDKIAEFNQTQMLKLNHGCKVCAFRDMQIICFGESICSEGHTPIKGKKYCNNFKLEG